MWHTRKVFFLSGVLLVSLALSSACNPFQTGDVEDIVEIKDSMRFYEEFNQHPVDDPRSQPCIVDGNQVAVILDRGYNAVWEIPFIAVGPIDCKDGTSLSWGYSAEHLSLKVLDLKYLP